MPENIEFRPRGEESQERGAQEQRELTALGASYLVQPIPDSPAELQPSPVLSQEEVDENVVQMLAGAEIDALSWPPAMLGAPLAGATVSELVGQLAAEGAGTGLTASEAVAAPAPAFDPAVLAQLASSIPQEQLQQLAQMFAAQQPVPQTQQQGDQSGWDAQTPAAFPADGGSGTPRDRWPPTPDEPKWSGAGGSGRGRGRGRPLDGVRQFRSRTACSFYAQGRQAHISMRFTAPPSSLSAKELITILLPFFFSGKQMQVRRSVQLQPRSVGAEANFGNCGETIGHGGQRNAGDDATCNGSPIGYWVFV